MYESINPIGIFKLAFEGCYPTNRADAANMPKPKWPVYTLTIPRSQMDIS